MGKNLEYQLETVSDDETRVSVRGSLTGVYSAMELQEALEAGAAEGRSILSLNLSQASEINSSTLGKLIILNKFFKERGILFRIRGCSQGIFNTLTLVRVDSILDISLEVF